MINKYSCCVTICQIQANNFLLSTIYKKLSKAIHPPPAPVDSLEEAPPPRSVVTCYLIGWGIPVIICGISGAIKWKDYGKSGT